MAGCEAAAGMAMGGRNTLLCWSGCSAAVEEGQNDCAQCQTTIAKYYVAVAGSGRQEVVLGWNRAYLPQPDWKNGKPPFDRADRVFPQIQT